MRKLILGLAATAAIAAPIAMAGTANAYTAPVDAPSYKGVTVTDPTNNVQTTIQNIDMNVNLTDAPNYYHEYDLTYTPATDGVVTFVGVGKQFDNGGETITGSIDTTNHTVTWLSHYLNMDGSVTVPDNTWGVTNAPYTVNPDNGDLDWTGISDQGQNGYG